MVHSSPTLQYADYKITKGCGVHSLPMEGVARRYGEANTSDGWFAEERSEFSDLICQLVPALAYEGHLFCISGQ